MPGVTRCFPASFSEEFGQIDRRAGIVIKKPQRKSGETRSAELTKIERVLLPTINASE
jgi:hypothetical protein